MLIRLFSFFLDVLSAHASSQGKFICFSAPSLTWLYLRSASSLKCLSVSVLLDREDYYLFCLFQCGGSAFICLAPPDRRSASVLPLDVLYLFLFFLDALSVSAPPWSLCLSVLLLPGSVYLFLHSPGQPICFSLFPSCLSVFSLLSSLIVLYLFVLP